jgi:uncharacterized protein (DUF488 family)
MKIYTIGFTKTSAENFFGRIAKSGANRLIDVRINNVSQLAGFAKKDDLEFFLKTICNIPYRHVPSLAPTAEMLKNYRNTAGSWGVYERSFLDLMRQRRIEELDRSLLDGACLLCSEDKPHHCHRRLVAEYLKEKWGDVQVVHL